MTLTGGLTKLALPTLPRLGARARKPKQPRPEYSVDVEGERRKRKRVTIEELSERGADILKEQAPDLPQTDKRSLFTRVTDILDIPRNVIANAIAAVTGVDVSQKREGTLLKKVYMSDILEKAGVPAGPVRSIIGFVGDVAIDPLTYATLGGGAGIKIAKHLPRGVGAFVGMAKAAAKTGKAAPELAKALNLRKGLPAIFAWLSKRYGAQKASKMLLAKQGGMLTRRIAREATKGAPGALDLLAKYGEKARPLFRLPFAKRGLLEVLPGKRAAAYKGVVETASEAGQRAVRVLGKVKKSARVASKEAAIGFSKAEALKTELSAANKKVADLQNKYSQYLKAESAARKIGYPGTTTRRIPLPTHELRHAKRELNKWKEIVVDVQKRYETAKAAETATAGLQSKFEVSKKAAELMSKVPGAPTPGLLKKAHAGKHIARYKVEQATKVASRITEYPAGKQRFRTPLQLAKTEAVAVQPLKGQAKTVLERAELDKILAAKRANIARRIETGPLAPGVLKQLQMAEMGKPLVRGKPGIIPSLQRLKQQIFGAPVTPARQQTVAIGQQIGPGSFATRETAEALVGRQAAPLIQKYVQAGIGTKEEIGTLIHRLAAAGPGGAGLQNLPRTDVLYQSVAKAKQIGLADDPAIQKLLADYWKSAELTAKTKGAAEIAGYTPGILTKPSRQRIKAMELAGKGSKFHEGRAELLTFELPGKEPFKMVSSSVDAKKTIAAMKKKGYKLAKTEGVSHAQMNAWAADPAKRQTLLGPDVGMPEVKALFEEDISKSAGAIAGQKVRAEGENQLKQLLSKYVVDMPKGGLEASPGFAHLARIKSRPNNPLYQMLERAGATSGKAYPVQIADMADNLTAVWDKPEMIEAMMRGTDKLLGIWKGFQLYHPAYLIRNVFQNFVGGVMAGANPAGVVNQLSDKRVRALTNALATGDTTAIRGITKQLGGKDVPLDTLYDFLKNYNAVNAGRAAAEIGKYGTIGGKLQRAKKGVTNIVYRMNTSVENNMRIATFMDFADKGMDMKSAFMQTLKAMPDLTDLTIFEREGMARLFPWYRWMRRNGGLQLFTYLPQKPAYAAMLPRFKNFVEGFRGKDNVPDELRPMWQDEQAAMQITGGKEAGTTFLAQTWFPFEEMYQLLGAPIQPEESARRMVSAMRPGAKFLAEAATGQDIFRRTPREPIGGIAGAFPKLPAALAGRSGTALDTLLGLRPVREWGPGGRVAEMPTVGAGAQRAVLGGALQPVEYQKGLQAKYWELENEQRRLRALINRAEQAGDQALVASLTRQWTAIIQQMHRWKLPLPRTLEQKLKGMGLPQPGPP